MSAPAAPLQALAVRLRPALFSALYLALFTALARVSGVDLLLFPELAALTTVVIARPEHPWSRAPVLLVLTPVLTGVVGLGLASWLPYGPVSVALVVAVCLLLIWLLRSPVMPALASGLLPLSLGIHTWHYPLALVPGTLGLALLATLRTRRSLISSSVQASAAASSDGALPRGARVSPWPPWQRWLVPLVVFLAGSLVLVHSLGSPLVLYPPLLVIAWETLAHGDACPWRSRPLLLLAVTLFAAMAGLLLVHWLGPVPLATLLAVLLVALVLDRLRFVCPPAYAVALLPFVVQAPSASFPLHVLAGTAWLVVVAALQAAPWPWWRAGRASRP